MGCRMTKKSKKNVRGKENHVEIIPDDLEGMKRKELQKLCKTHKLKAIGKVVLIRGGGSLESKGFGDFWV